MQNQDVHKNLRRNKNGVPLDNVAENLSAFNYKRPTGFTLVPSLLESSQSTSSASNLSNVSRNHSYFEHIQDEMQR